MVTGTRLNLTPQYTVSPIFYADLDMGNNKKCLQDRTALFWAIRQRVVAIYYGRFEATYPSQSSFLIYFAEEV